MKKRSLFKKLFSSSRNGEPDRSENTERDYVAESLEARVLFSAAPVEAEFAPEAVAEEAPAVNEAQSDGDFAPLEGADLPSGESNLNETAILTSYENLTRAEIVQIKEAALQDKNSGSPGETDPAPENVSEATDSLADVIEGDAAAGTLDDATLHAFWNEGINRWSDSGISADQLTALQSAEVEVHDLEGNILGATSATSVVIDDDGAGRGWFVDATPEQDEEFAALLESPEGIDLLSVVMHEQGHLIGLDGSEEFDNIMNGIFGEGERRLPADGQADGAVAGSLEGVHFATAVGANVVSGSVTGNLLVIDTPRVSGDDGHPANDGHSIVVAGSSGDQFVGATEGWEPDGSLAQSAGGTNIRWMEVGSEATWTFDLPDGAIVNDVYASFRGQGNTTGNHEYSYDEGTPTTVVRSHGTAATGDLILDWTDSLGATDNVNFERIISGPITVSGGDGFAVSLTAVTNFAWSDAVVVDYTLAVDDNYASDEDTVLNLTNQSAYAGEIQSLGSDGSLIGFWDFNEGSGSSVLDLSGNANDGTITGATYTSDGGGFTGETGNHALDFDGSGDVVSIPSAASAFDDVTSNNEITISMWVFGDGQPRNDTILRGAGAGGLELNAHLPWSNSNVYWDTGGCCGGTQRLNGPAPTSSFEDQWNHWTFVKDGATNSIYHNGSQFLSAGGKTDPIGDITSFFIGAANGAGAQSYQGLIDDFAVFSKGLSATEVADLYASGNILANDAANSTNLALGGTASQSSTDFGGVPERAIDGNTNGVYGGGSVTHTAGNGPHSWKVDLGEIREIDEIVVWERTDGCCNNLLNNFTVEVYDGDPDAGGVQQFSYFQAGDFTMSLSIDVDGIDPSVRGDYVQINKASGSLQLAEVQVFSDTPEIISYDSTSDKGAAVTVNPDGSFDYDPTASATLQALAEGENTTDTFTYTISDGQGEDPLGGVLDDLELWLDASDINGDGSIVTNGALINDWKDKSGNGHDANVVQSDPNYVANGLNGLGVVNFDGNDQISLSDDLRDSLDDPDGSYTLITVARYTGTDNERLITVDSNHNWLFGFHGNSSNRWYTDGWVNLDTPYYGDETDWHVHSGLMNGAPADPQGLFYRDGNLETNSTNGNDNGLGGNNNFANYAPDKLALGGWNVNSEFSTGEVAEVILYDRLLSDTERLAVEAYLEAKYDLANDGGTGLATIDTATVSVQVDGVNDPPTANDNAYVTDEDTSFSDQDTLAISDSSVDLLNLDALDAGDYQFTADGQTFDGYVEQHDGSGWLLIGRGREGWEFDTDGQGNISDVNQGLGTAAAFAPAAYSDAIINDLLDQAGLTLDDVEIRLSRASNTTGTGEYQDIRLTDFAGFPNSNADFTFNFDNTSRSATFSLLNVPAGLSGAEVRTFTTDTYDTFNNGGNDADRIFTWAWGGHNNQKGFSYGSNVAGAFDTTSFLWDHPNNGNNHAIPYTEVYVRALNGTQVAPSLLSNDVEVDTNDTLNIISAQDSALSGGSVTVNSDKGASVTVNDDGTFNYDPTGSATLQALAAGESTTDTFTYTITDGGSVTDAQDYRNTVLDLNPVAYYTMDSGDLVDADTVSNLGSATAQTASLVGGASFTGATGGVFGGGLSIADNSNQRLDVDAGSLDLGRQWTVSAWFNDLHDTSTWRTLARGAGGDHQIIVEAGQNDLGTFSNADGAFRDSGHDLLPGDTAWHHIAAVANADTNTTDFYIDGTFVGQSDRASITDVEWIGNHSGGQPFAQTIDEFAVFNEALSAGDVSALAGNSVDTATVTVTVNGVNDAPVANDDAYDAYTTDEDTPLSNSADPLSLLDLDAIATGNHTITADGQTFEGYVEQHDGSGWLLIGRGREGWEFDTDGQGNIEDVNQGLGTIAAFGPAAYSDAMINDLVTSAGLDLTDVEIRLKRATDPAGTTFQDARWRDFTQTAWTWNLSTSSNAGGFEPVTYEVVSGSGAPFTDTTGNTRDALGTPGSDSGNNTQRTFTWPWGGHANQRGFSYGTTVTNGSNTASSFLWESGNEQHAIPYTEVYIRALNGTQVAPNLLSNDVEVDASDTLTVVAADGTALSGGTATVGSDYASVTVNDDGSFIYTPDPFTDDQLNFDGTSTGVGTIGGTWSGAVQADAAGTTPLGQSAINFTGSGDFFLPVNPSETSYTFSAWFNTTESNVQIAEITNIANTTQNDRNVWIDSEGHLRTRVWSDETIVSPESYNDGEWHHVAHVFGGTEGGQKMYVDGVEVASGAKASSDFNDTFPSNALRVGEGASAGRFVGDIGGIQLFDSALNPLEIQFLHEGSLDALPEGASITDTFTYTVSDTIAPQTVGSDLVNRPSNDGATGFIFVQLDPIAYDPDVAQSVVRWSFFDNDGGDVNQQVTPLLLEDVGGTFEIRGIGTTRTSLATGVQTFDFDLVSGSAQIDSANYFVAFKDGSNGTNNNGVIDYTGSGSVDGVRWFGTHTTFSTGQDLGGGSFGARDYSIQFELEPSTLDTATVTVTIEGTNDAPTVSGPVSFDATEDLEPDLQLTFDENGVVTDSVSGTVTGSFNGVTRVDDPGQVSAVAFTDANSRVLLSTPHALGSDWTIAADFKDLKFSNSQWMTLARSTTSQHHIIIEKASGEIGMWNGAFRSSGVNVSSYDDGQWHSIAAVGSGGDTTFYLDGVEIGTVVGHQGSGNVYAVGNFQGGGQAFSDYLDDFQVFDRVLDAGEIAALHGDTFSDVDLLANASDVDSGDTLGVINLVKASGDDSGLTVAGSEISIDRSAYHHLDAGDVETITYTYDVGDFPPVGDDPVGYWRLNESTLPTAEDTAGDRDGTYVNFATADLDQEGAYPGGISAQFDGTNNEVHVPSDTELNNILTGDYSVEFWMYKDSEQNDWQRLVGKGTNGSRTLGVWEENGAGKRILFQVGGTNLFSTTTIEIGQWYHVAATMESGTMKLFINGQQEPGTATASVPTNTSPLTFGKMTGLHKHFPGRLDEIALFDKALSGEQVEAHYDAGVTALSSVATSATVTITGLNDAPVLGAGVGIFNDVGVSQLESDGDLVSDLVNGQITDVDDGAIIGAIAVTGTNTTAGSGHFEYSIGTSGTWTEIDGINGLDPVADDNALLLLSNDRIRFVPGGVTSGQDIGELTFRAWDQTGGTVGDVYTKVDASSTGGTTPFSADAQTSKVTVAELIKDGTEIVYAPTDGEINTLTVAYDAGAGELIFTDSTSAIGSGFPGGGTSTVRVGVDPGDSLTIETGDEDDTITISDLGTILYGNLTVDGEAGQDQIIYRADGVTLDTGGSASFNAEEIDLVNGDLTTTDGDITVTGTGGTGADFVGVNVHYSDLTVGGSGSMTLTGQGGDGSAFRNFGVHMTGSTLTRDATTGAGTITVTGTGAGTGYRAIGVRLEGTAIDTSGGTAAGDVTLQGTAAPGGDGYARGVYITAGSVTTGSGGGIDIDGTGGATATGSHNVGVVIKGGTTLDADGAGTIDIAGTGGTGDKANVGVSLNRVTATVESGNINLAGTSAGTTHGNLGVSVISSSLTSSDGGDLGLVGTAGTGSVASGVGVVGTTLGTTGDGTITIQGTGATGAGNSSPGVTISKGSDLDTVDGAILIEGTGNATGRGNSHGVNILSGSTINATGGAAGTLTLTGTGAASAKGSSGVLVNGSALGTSAGLLTISGTGTSTTYGSGISLRNAGVSSTSGNIVMTGVGSATATGSRSTGITVSRSAIGGADLSLTGTGGTGSRLNEGVRIGSSTLDATGNLTILGSSLGTGKSNSGVYILGSTLNRGTGTITGTGGGGLNSFGVFMHKISGSVAVSDVSGTSGPDEDDDLFGNFF